ncbi:MAG: type II secretion system F family protein [Gammaproteobacteria bacterium]
MATFTYRAVDRQGKPVCGELAADDAAALEARLSGAGYWLIQAEARARPARARGVKLSRRDSAELFGNLAALLEAGLPLIDALRAIERESAEGPARRLLTDLRLAVETGTTFADALARHPLAFSDHLRNAITAGEFGGNLPAALEACRSHLEWTERLVQDVKQASIYPAVVLLAVAGFVALLFGFVVPRFAAILAELDLALPLVTRVVVGVGGFFQAHGLHLFAALAAAIAAARLAQRHWAAFALGVDWAKLRLPVFGELNAMICLSRLTHQLALLLGAGVPITRALALCEGAAGNRQYEQVIGKALAAVTQGQPFSEALRDEPLVPGLLKRMIAVGEETGRLEQALAHVSRQMDEHIPRRIKRVFSILEPAVMLVLIGMVGTVAMSIFLPLMSLIGGLQR